MEIVRSVQMDDLDELQKLLRQATYGLTTLQITKEQLRERLELANFAFSRQTEKPSGDPYVFVLEDLKLGALVGMSCIFSKTGGYEPFYSYRRVRESNYCEHLDLTQEVETLQLAKIHDGPTEIGSLFLSPEYRGHGRGRLLSLSRFVFMAAHPKRFADTVIAEMRGVMSDQGDCPFWEAIGRQFFKMDFPQADILSTDKRFIESFMPKYPIYVNLLPESGRAVMGEVHPRTKPALAMLEAEGFKKIDMIDIFDGGPVVECATQEIRAVQRTRQMSVSEISPEVEGGELLILATFDKEFRAMLGMGNDTGEGLAISESVAAALHVRVSNTISALSLHPTPAAADEMPTAKTAEDSDQESV